MLRVDKKFPKAEFQDICGDMMAQKTFQFPPFLGFFWLRKAIPIGC